MPFSPKPLPTYTVTAHAWLSLKKRVPTYGVKVNGVMMIEGYVRDGDIEKARTVAVAKAQTLASQLNEEPRVRRNADKGLADNAIGKYYLIPRSHLIKINVEL